MNESSGKAAAAEPTILLVDDDVVARTAVASYLRECGFQVMESDTEADGKKLLESKPSAFDIAICATSEASSASRLEFARWLRAKHPHIRVLVAASIAKTIISIIHAQISTSSGRLPAAGACVKNGMHTLSKPTRA